jgi:hypothetical protein
LFIFLVFLLLLLCSENSQLTEDILDIKESNENSNSFVENVDDVSDHFMMEEQNKLELLLHIDNNITKSYFSSVKQDMKKVNVQKLLKNYKRLYRNSFNITKKYQNQLDEIDIPMIYVDCSFKIKFNEFNLLKEYYTIMKKDPEKLRTTITDSMKQEVVKKNILSSLSSLSSSESIVLRLLNIIQRINFASSHIYHSLSRKRFLFDNILLIKEFRTISSNDDKIILKNYYEKYSTLAYHIKENPNDDLINPIKNRSQLLIDEKTIVKTPILAEIYYSLFNILNPAHRIIEHFAFIHSVSDGEEQYPHLDFDYNPRKPISLLSSSPDSPTYQSLLTGDAIEFFHPAMCYSFLFCIEPDTVLHFVNCYNEHITVHLQPGDLIIWSGQQIHFGGKYMMENLRLFGMIRAIKYGKKNENEFYWYNIHTRSMVVMNIDQKDETIRSSLNDHPTSSVFTK